ncbi:MAG: hypothetical protein BBJ57_09520 [Desulfobacterales bacterium PC51MH44]|nr:MAG: hypothetical protein BBJ57_09520 [Desulfobacterales bacterium PC51MH44]
MNAVIDRKQTDGTVPTQKKEPEKAPGLNKENSYSIELMGKILFSHKKPGPLGQVRVIRLCLKKRCKSLK